VTAPGANWAGTHRYRARELHQPTSREQLQQIVAAAANVHVLGSRHSFTEIADAEELVSLDALPADVVVDPAAGTVNVGGAMRYGDLAEALHEHGLALHNLASLPHISVGGAIATATHGSGDANGNLATATAALELVTSSGDVVTAARGDDGFDGMVVGVGALGAVTRVTLDVEPAYDVCQDVFEDLAWDALFEHFDEITAAGYSVSLFTRFGAAVDQVWVKSRVGAGRGGLFGARPAQEQRNPVPGMDPANTTPQLGEPGPWWDRLPHFRMGFTPSNGEEIQSEYLVDRRDARGAIDAVRALAGNVQPLLLIAEIRTIAADRLWMSPQYGRDTVGIHFTWRRDPTAVARVLVDVEAALEPFAARPHWGKLFLMDGGRLAPLYERLPDFRRLAERLDPRGAFRNDWLARAGV
jgi:alditol oxidase